MFSSPIITVRKVVSSISQSDEEGGNAAAITPTATTSPQSAGMERKGSTVTWRSRGSKILSRLGVANSGVTVNEHSRIQELVHILNDDDQLKALMAHLLATDNDAAVRIRFVRYVTQYEQETNTTERKRKLAGLADLFLSETARCRMDELPAALLHDASRAKIFIMNQLIDHHQVLDIDTTTL